MDELAFYEALWGDSTLLRSIWYGDIGKAPNKRAWFSDTQKALDFAVQLSALRKYNIYHSCALFAPIDYTLKLVENKPNISELSADTVYVWPSSKKWFVGSAQRESVGIINSQGTIKTLNNILINPTTMNTKEIKDILINDLTFQKYTPKLRRIQKNATEINALWIDLDLKKSGCKTLKEVLSKAKLFKNFCFQTQFWLVHSGNGFHLYWMLDKPLNGSDWKLAANKLKEYVAAYSIPTDSSRTCDSASLLRVLNTYNLKDKDNHKTIKLLKTNVKVDTALIMLPASTKIKSSKIEFKAADFAITNTLTEISHSQSSLTPILKKCHAMREFSKTGYADNEPAWYAALSVVRHCKNGTELAHKYSALATCYSKEETDKKLDQLITGDVGPRLCEGFRDMGLCSNCNFYKKIKSAIQLGVEVSPIDKPVVDLVDTNEIARAKQLIGLAPQKGWIVGKEGMYRLVDDIPVLLSHVPFYIIDLIKENADDATLLTVVIRVFKKKGIVDFKVPLKNIADDKKLLSDFNSRGIFPANKKHLKEYLITYYQKIEHIEVHNSITALGWQSNNSFIYGSRGEGFSQDGSFLKCILDKKLVEYVKGFEAKGSLKKWNNLMRIYNLDDSWMPHLFSLFCSLGAPLLPLTSAKGIVVSLQGSTGIGKTLAHIAAMSVWGNPEEAGVLGVKDSPTAILGRLGAVKNLPLRLDEATLMGAARLSGLIFDIVNGRGRSRATRDGSLSNTSAEWQTLALVTTNRPLLENDVSVISEAERVRILELPVTMPKNMAKLGSYIGKLITDNHGLLGRKFIKWVINNKQETINLLDTYATKFQQYVSDDKRFWVSCGAIVFTALKISIDQKFLEVDYERCEKWFIKLLSAQTSVNDAYIKEARGFETKDEFVRALADWLTGQIMYLNQENIVIEKPMREIKGRIVRADDGTKFLYVRAPILKEFVQKHYVCGIAKVRTDLDIEKPKPKRFGTTGVVRCYAFKLKGDNV